MYNHLPNLGQYCLLSTSLYDRIFSARFLVRLHICQASSSSDTEGAKNLLKDSYLLSTVIALTEYCFKLPLKSQVLPRTWDIENGSALVGIAQVSFCVFFLANHAILHFIHSIYQQVFLIWQGAPYFDSVLQAPSRAAKVLIMLCLNSRALSNAPLP